MKKIYAAVLVLLLVSCAPKEEAAVVKPLSIEDVPKSEETRKLDRKEIYTLKRQLEQISGCFQRGIFYWRGNGIFKRI